MDSTFRLPRMGSPSVCAGRSPVPGKHLSPSIGGIVDSDSTLAQFCAVLAKSPELAYVWPAVVIRAHGLARPPRHSDRPHEFDQRTLRPSRLECGRMKIAPEPSPPITKSCGSLARSMWPSTVTGSFLTKSDSGRHSLSHRTRLAPHRVPWI